MQSLDQMIDAPWAFDFFLTCRRLEFLHPHLPFIGDGFNVGENPINFGQDPSF